MEQAATAYARAEAAEAALRREREIFVRGPVVVFRWIAAEGWPVQYVLADVEQYGYRAADLLSGRVPLPVANPRPAPVRRGSGTILVVDDEPAVCHVAQATLENAGFTVLTAADGRAGLDVFWQRGGEILAVILDLTMAHISGDEVFREMQQMRPTVPVILCSGYNEQDATARFCGTGLAGFIQKPYRPSALLDKLLSVLPG